MTGSANQGSMNAGPKSTIKVTYGSIRGGIEKPRMELLPYDALLEVARALGVGAHNYGDFTWREGTSWLKIFGSLMRHLSKWAIGENIDAETGQYHLALATCNLLFLLSYQINGVGDDDRVVTNNGENNEH